MKTLNIDEAAEFLKSHPRTIRRLVSAGKIPYCRPLSRRLVFFEEDLVAWMKSGQNNGAQRAPSTGGGECRFTKEEVSGGYDSQRQTDARYAKVLKLPTGGKLRNPGIRVNLSLIGWTA
ncbi:Helix-turn-helix domain-containing protein [Gammaproteobacteria bacterium]